MHFLSRHAGTSISALGAVLILCGTLLPTYRSGDYEFRALQNAPVWFIALLIAPALLGFGINALAWFRKLPPWLVVLCLVVIISTFLLCLFLGELVASFACFDTCPPGGFHFETGYWLPLMGFLLSGIGVVVTAATQKRPTASGSEISTSK